MIKSFMIVSSQVMNPSQLFYPHCWINRWLDLCWKILVTDQPWQCGVAAHKKSQGYIQHWSWPWSWPRTGVQGLGGWLDRSWWVCGWLTVEQDSRVFQCIQIVIRTLSWARGHRLATSAEVIILSQVVSQAWTTCAGGLVPSDQIQTCNNLVGDLCP